MNDLSAASSSPGDRGNLAMESRENAGAWEPSGEMRLMSSTLVHYGDESVFEKGF